MNPTEDGTKTVPPVRLQEFMWDWQNSGYEYKLWNGQSMETYIRENFAQFYDIYMCYDSWIKRCDAFRYMILYNMGGFYIDADTQKLGELDDLIKHKVVLLQSNTYTGWGSKLYNCFMASEQYHPFFEFCMDQLESSKDICLVFASTGPDFLMRTYQQYPNKDEIIIINENKLPIKHMAAKTWVWSQIQLIFDRYFFYSVIIIIIFLIVLICATRWSK